MCLRVLGSARAIQAEVGGELQIVELPALLHDVGDAKFHDGVERSAEFAREILGGLGADDELIEHVAHIVDNISFRKGESAKPLSLEGPSRAGRGSAGRTRSDRDRADDRVRRGF